MRTTIAVLAAMATAAIAASPIYYFDPKSPKNCDLWLDNEGMLPCMAVPDMFDITPEQYLAWNPSLDQNCEPFNLYQSYCVRVCTSNCETTTTTTWSTASTSTRKSTSTSSNTSKVSTTSKATTTSSKATQTTQMPISTPKPTQLGMVRDCTTFHKVATGDTCDSIAKKYGISLFEFYTFNTGVGDTCANLLKDYYVCVRNWGWQPVPTSTVPTSTSKQPTSTSTGNGVETPTPVTNEITTSCKTFYRLVDNDTCVVVARKFSISASSLVKWNPALTARCDTSLFIGYFICVGSL